MLEKYPNAVNIVQKHFPLRNHQYARSGALASLAAAKQGKYAEFTSVMLNNYKTLDEEKITRYATDLGLDMEKFELDRNGPDALAILNDDLKMRLTAKVRAVPSIFINGRKSQNRSFAGFVQMIEEELAKLPEDVRAKALEPAPPEPEEAASAKTEEAAPAKSDQDAPAKPAEGAKEPE